MGIASSLAGWVAPKSKAEMEAAKAALDARLAPGSDYWKSGDLGLGTPGSAGYNALASAAQLGANDLTGDFSAMDRDKGALKDLAAQYRKQYEEGGLAERAATARATSSMADAGGGGQEGVINLQNASQALSKQGNAVANQERTQSGAQANQNDLMAGMLDVRKAAFQAALTHANIQKNLASQKGMFDLQSAQTGLNQQLQSGAQNLQSSSNQIAQGVKNVQTNLGFQTLNAGLAAGAAGSALGTEYSKRTPVDTSVSSSELAGATQAAYDRQGLAPISGSAALYKTAQDELIANQTLLNSLTRAAVTFPGMPADSSSYLSNKDSYPIKASLR